MPYIASNFEYYEGKKVGTGQCVAYVQAAANAPSTSLWKEGAKVLGSAPGVITKGTVIATFEDGHYGNHAHGNHAAIYISHDDHGILVYDQWLGQPVHRRTIHDHGGHGSASNDATKFSIVE